MPLSHFVPAYPSPSSCPQVHSLSVSIPATDYFQLNEGKKGQQQNTVYDSSFKSRIALKEITGSWGYLNMDSLLGAGIPSMWT